MSLERNDFISDIRIWNTKKHRWREENGGENNEIINCWRSRCGKPDNEEEKNISTRLHYLAPSHYLHFFRIPSMKNKGEEGKEEQERWRRRIYQRKSRDRIIIWRTKRISQRREPVMKRTLLSNTYDKDYKGEFFFCFFFVRESLLNNVFAICLFFLAPK